MRIITCVIFALGCGASEDDDNTPNLQTGDYAISGSLYYNNCPFDVPESFNTEWTVGKDDGEWTLAYEAGHSVDGVTISKKEIDFHDASSDFDAGSGCTLNRTVEIELFPADDVFHAALTDEKEADCPGDYSTCTTIYDIDGDRK